MKKQLLIVLCLIALPAAAHPGQTAGGFLDGFVHPFSGLDHLLAMLGVGLWSRQQGRSLALPAAFVLAMAAGAFLPLALPLALAQLDAAIAITLVLCGTLVAAAVRLPLAAGATLVAVCAFLHGQAHGAELPGLASAAGFLTASAVLLAAGAAFRWQRLAGALIGAVGLCLFAGLA